VKKKQTESAGKELEAAERETEKQRGKEKLSRYFLW
jgi:hypothetical protein